MATATAESWLESFKRDWKANADEAERNSLMDSGWSANVADRCRDRAVMLIRDIVLLLAQQQTTPADMLDRPQLVELMEAARLAVGQRGEERA